MTTGTIAIVARVIAVVIAVVRLSSDPPLAKWPRLDLERTVAGTRLVQMAESGELKMAARRYKAA